MRLKMMSINQQRDFLFYNVVVAKTRSGLEENLFDVKVSCIAVRTALQEFVEFSDMNCGQFRQSSR